MRLDTYSFRTRLIEGLESPRAQAQIELDDWDVLRVRLRSGEKIEIHIIEREVDVDEINMIFTQNQAVKTHTLYLMWCDMTLPDDGEIFEPDSWLLTLHTIFNQKVYAFKVYGDQSFIYPIHLEWVSPTQRRVHYGAAVNMADLGCAVNQVQSEQIGGNWYIADFNDTPNGKQYQRTYKTMDDRNRKPQPTHDLAMYYALLEVEITTDRDLLKKAYRKLARAYHPDVNQQVDAHERMQQINEAYRKILAWLDEIV